jgi:hypothetical protein
MDRNETMTIPTTSYVLPLTTVYRRRMLPAPGKVLVRQGQKVAPQDVVAQARIAADHVLLDVARGLRVHPKKVEKYIDRVAGEQVAEGDVIATGPQGVVRRMVRSPIDGRIVYIKNGQVLLQLAEEPFELKAGYAGVISELIPDQGVIVEMSGALIQGVWGNGVVEFGLLVVISREPGAVLKLENVDVSLRGGILLGGHLADLDTLKALAEIPIRGLILGSMPSRLAETAQEMPFPVLLTDGFGRLPMNMAAYRLLSTNNNREISLNAEKFDPYRGYRPEVVIPLPITGKPAPPPLPQAIAPQHRVRLIRAPYAAQVGTIQGLVPGLTVFPSGIVAEGAQVRLDSGERVVVPLANLQVLEYK